MVNLTFGEQVKIILGRKGMTIKQLAELVEERTGKPMSRQNMTQRLGRDNFQEQDMRLIADILGCKFQLSIMEMETAEEVVEEISEPVKAPVEAVTETTIEAEELHPLEREITIGELADMADERNILRKGIKGYFKKSSSVKPDNAKSEAAETQIIGDVNPYTGKEYKTNSVRMHPKRIGYVQVYDQEQHKWTDMTEWAFLGYQERKKVLLGKDYEPPIYLD